MLKQRVITALILAPLAIWGTLALSTGVFAAIVGLIFVFGAWEWARLAGMQGWAQSLYAGAVAGAGAALWPVLTSASAPLLGAAALWWLVALVLVVMYPAGKGFFEQSNAARALAGVLVLLPGWGALILVHGEAGPGYALLLLLLVWGADTGAYFAGRRFGRHKLAPRVSPGKTLEGVGGALGVAVLIGGVGAVVLAAPPLSLIVLSLVAVAFSILGDLIESLFKRVAAIKDSGMLLPGHGGILDRIDSLTAAAPVFAITLYGLGVVA